MVSKYKTPWNMITTRRFPITVYANTNANNNNKLMIKEFVGFGRFIPPLCMNCKFYLHPFISPHYPEAGCERFDVVIPCMEARTSNTLCGLEGKNFEPKT
jgi:hypothetical protein